MSWVRRVLLLVLWVGLMAGVLFGCAGRVDLPSFWAWLVVLVIAWLSVASVMDPELMKERLKPGPGGTDRRLRIVAMPLALAHIALAGLDVGRFHWSDTVPLPLQVAGLVGFAVSLAVSVWAICVNPFFSSVVRVQSERGHVVVTGGPYRWVRHPGYAALLVNMPCSGLLLGSWWSLAPVAVILLLVLRRAIIEDRYLQMHLDGYVEYTHRVRYRLLPGVW